MIIIGISVCIHIYPACILHIKDSVCIELLGVLCTPPEKYWGYSSTSSTPLPTPMVLQHEDECFCKHYSGAGWDSR